MGAPQSNLDELIKDPKVAGLLKDQALLQSLLCSPDTQKLMRMLSQNAGDGLKTAAASAAKGNTGALTDLVRQVMRSQEGAELVQRIQQAVPGQNSKP